MSEERKEETLQAESPATEEMVATQEVATENEQTKKGARSISAIIAKTTAFLKSAVSCKWIKIADKIARPLALIALALSAYLGVVGFGFDVAFVALLVSTILSVFVCLVAAVNLLFARGKKKRVRKPIKRALFLFALVFVASVLQLSLSQIPHRDGRFGGFGNLQGYDGIYYDVVEDENGDDVVKICDADTKAEKVVIPKEIHGYAVKYVFGIAFNNSPDLKEIDVPTSHEYFSAADGVLYSKDYSTLIAYPAGRNTLTRTYTVHHATKTIGDCAFRNNRYLKDVVLSNVVTIGENAFENAASLTSVVCSDKLETISHNAFNGCTKIQEFVIPASVTFVGNSAFNGLTSVQNIVIYASAENEALWSPSWQNGCRARIERLSPQA